MATNHILSPDSQVVVLLCSSLGSESDVLRPLRPREWNEFVERVRASSLSAPGELLGLTAGELSNKLGLQELEAERIRNLLERGGQLAIELDRLASRGIWVLTRLDQDYPSRLSDSLKHSTPPVLFGAGDISLLNRAGVAVVGSRNIDEDGVSFAQRIGELCARDGAPVISGGARGTDAIAMGAALEAGGRVVGVLADSLERVVRAPDVREPLIDGRLTMVTPYWPSVGFSVPGAMGRNKIIYGLAEYAVIVASDFEKGGTWAGAVEALKGGFCAVFVRDDEHAPEGNRELVKKGAHALQGSELNTDGLMEHLAGLSEAASTQGTLISEAPSSYQPLLPISGNSADRQEAEKGWGDLYEIVWPHLRSFLEQPRTLEEIKDTFNLERSQVRAWLKRAQEEGRVQKHGKPVRYRGLNCS